VSDQTPITDGGPAFPRAGAYRRMPGDQGERDYIIQRPQEGMSLRDWFAGQALQHIEFEADDLGTATERARMAYRVADAMLAARSPQPAASAPVAGAPPPAADPSVAEQYCLARNRFGYSCDRARGHDGMHMDSRMYTSWL
jgi:uncharacterized protein YodC (DUF2158 family)